MYNFYKESNIDFFIKTYLFIFAYKINLLHFFRRCWCYFIGRVGETAFVKDETNSENNVHLHYELHIRQNNSTYKPVDPKSEDSKEFKDPQLMLEESEKFDSRPSPYNTPSLLSLHDIKIDSWQIDKDSLLKDRINHYIKENLDYHYKYAQYQPSNPEKTNQ